MGRLTRREARLRHRPEGDGTVAVLADVDRGVAGEVGSFHRGLLGESDSAKLTGATTRRGQRPGAAGRATARTTGRGERCRPDGRPRGSRAAPGGRIVQRPGRPPVRREPARAGAEDPRVDRARARGVVLLRGGRVGVDDLRHDDRRARPRSLGSPVASARRSMVLGAEHREAPRLGAVVVRRVHREGEELAHRRRVHRLVGVGLEGAALADGVVDCIGAEGWRAAASARQPRQYRSWMRVMPRRRSQKRPRGAASSARPVARCVGQPRDTWRPPRRGRRRADCSTQPTLRVLRAGASAPGGGCGAAGRARPTGRTRTVPLRVTAAHASGRRRGPGAGRRRPRRRSTPVVRSRSTSAAGAHAAAGRR